jgi:hypothetical protein
MATQSLISLVILGLVVARAVNVLHLDRVTLAWESART